MGDSDGLASQADYEAIVAAVQDYAGGWYDGDPVRMRRALHPDLVKRTVVPGPTNGTWALRPPTSAERLVALTERGEGASLAQEDRKYQIDVLGIFRHTASVRCVSPAFVDYLHLAKAGEGRWLIVHALWEERAPAANRTP